MVYAETNRAILQPDQYNGSGAVVIGSGAIGIEGADYLRIITKEGRVVGGQAIGRFGDVTGLFSGAMWRKDQIPDIRANWPRIVRKGSSYPWTCRRIRASIGLKS